MSLSPSLALAIDPTKYTVLEPLPYVTEGCVQDSGEPCASTATYLPGLFKLAIGISTVLAVLMLIYGGFTYITTDAFGKKGAAKAIIENALWGLLFVLGAWIIVYTIDEKLVSFDLSITPIEQRENTNIPGAGRPMTSEEISADGAIRSRLTDPEVGIGVNHNPCLRGEGYGCTNLNGLPEYAILGLISLKSDCDCDLTITGGTEPGPHSTHGIDRPVVDLADDPSLRAWLVENHYIVPAGTGASFTLPGGRRVIMTYERAGEGRSTGDHWHVRIN